MELVDADTGERLNWGMQNSVPPGRHPGTTPWSRCSCFWADQRANLVDGTPKTLTITDLIPAPEPEDAEDVFGGEESPGLLLPGKEVEITIGPSTIDERRWMVTLED